MEWVGILDVQQMQNQVLWGNTSPEVTGSIQRKPTYIAQCVECLCGLVISIILLKACFSLYFCEI